MLIIIHAYQCVSIRGKTSKPELKEKWICTYSKSFLCPNLTPINGQKLVFY